MTSEGARETRVHIVLPADSAFTPAGTFRVSRDGSGMWLGEFVYGRSYLSHPDAVELDSRELTLGPGVRETVRLEGFFGAIRDAMPDAWGRRLIERQRGRSRLAEFDYLLEGDVDRAGALGFGELRSIGSGAGVPGVPALRELMEAVGRVLRGEAPSREAPVQDLLSPGTSLGGARPKVTVQEGDALWLAKFGRPDDRWDEPRVEHGLLRLAARCGLRAAESRVEAVGGRSVLLVRRFDRAATDAGYLRARFVSALTLLRAEESATGRERWSYLLLADEVRRTSEAPRRDLEELFRRMCFNAAVSNTDDHPRNHAMIAFGRGWRLSPAYDLTPGPGFSREPPWLALECGFRGRQASRENLLSGAGRFLLRHPEAERILDSVFAEVRTSWREAMAEAGVSRRDVEGVASAFEA